MNIFGILTVTEMWSQYTNWVHQLIILIFNMWTGEHCMVITTGGRGALQFSVAPNCKWIITKPPNIFGLHFFSTSVHFLDNFHSKNNVSCLLLLPKQNWYKHIISLFCSSPHIVFSYIHYHCWRKHDVLSSFIQFCAWASSHSSTLQQSAVEDILFTSNFHCINFYSLSWVTFKTFWNLKDEKRRFE